MPRYAVVVRDQTVDLYDEKAPDDLIGCEVVDAHDENDAIFVSDYNDHRWHWQVHAYQVPNDTPLGEHDDPPEAE